MNYGLVKLAAYTPIQEGENLARRNAEYYDHVPESTSAGAEVGAAQGVLGGALTGYSIGKGTQRLDTLANTNAKFRFGANQALNSMGFEGSDIRNVTRNLPSPKTATKMGLGVGLLGGALGGAYKGMQTGVGLNDRQYLLQRNIEPHELVNNSAMSAMQMGGATLNPLAPIMNQAFGAQVGMLRRKDFANTEDGSLERR